MDGDQNKIEFLQSCDDKIIQFLQNQKIKYEIREYQIQIEDLEDSQLNLEIHDCFVNKTLVFQELEGSLINNLTLKNITSTSKRLIQYQSTYATKINNIELENCQIRGQGELIKISSSQAINIERLSSISSSNIYFESNQIKVSYLYIDSLLVLQQSVYLNSKYDIFIDTLYIINEAKGIFISQNSLNIQNIFIYSKTSSNASVLSQKIFIEAINVGAAVDIFFNIPYELGEFQTKIEQFYIKEIKQIIQEQHQIKDLTIVFDILTQNLRIGHIQFDERQIVFQLHIMLIPNVIIDQLDLNLNSIIQIVDVGIFKMSNIHFTSIDFQKISQNLIEFQNVDDIVLDSFQIKDTLFESSNMISVQKSDSLQLINFFVQNCFFQNNLINLDTVSFTQILNSTFILQSNSSMFSYFKPLGSNQNDYLKQKKEWLIGYNQLDGARSLIQMNWLQITASSDTKNLMIDGVNADFGGFDSRFISSYYSYMNQVIKNSNFSNMKTHQNGGCLRFYILQELSISSSKFINCASNKFGGAISISYFLEINFMNCHFQGNQAQFGGAISIQTQNGKKTIQNLSFKNNTSTYLENDIFDYGPLFKIKEVLEYIPNFFESQYLIRKIPISPLTELIPGSIYIIIMDMTFFQKTYSLEEQKNSVAVSNIIKGNLYDFYMLNKDRVQPEDISQYLNYEIDLKELSKDTSYILLQPYSSMKRYAIQFIYTIGVLDDIFFYTSDCIEGQQKVFYNYLDNSKYLCQYCESMSANYRNDSFQCQQCDSQMFSKCYLNYSELNPGYWRQYLEIDKSQIYKCQSNHLEQCLGGSGYGNQLCSEGRIGNECSACDETAVYWNATYTSNSLYSCVKCNSIESNTLKIWISIISFIIILFLLIHSNFKKIQNYVYQQYLQRMQIMYIGTSFTKLGLASVFIKVLSFNASLLVFIQNQLEINLKNTLIERSIQYSSPLQTSFISINCALYDLFPNQQHYGLVRLKMYLIIPLIIIPTTLLFPFLRYLFKKSSRRFLKYNISLTIIYTLFIVFYNPILSVCLDSITCKTFGNGEKALQIDLTAPCDSNYEYYQFAIIGLVFYSISIPFFIIFNLIKNKKKLYSIQALFQFGFLYQEYKKDFYFWEIVRFSIKVSFLIVQKIFFQSKELMNCLFVIILICYQFCLQKYQPFSRNLLNKMEMTSVLILLINFISTIIFQAQNNSTNSFIQYLPTIFLITSLILALIFIMYSSLLIMMSFAETIFLKIQNNSRFSCLLKCFPQFQQQKSQKRIRENFKKLRNLVKYIIQFKSQHDNQQETFKLLEL